MVTAPFTKCYWEFTGICNCPGSNNTPENCHHPNSECVSGICTKEQCYTLIFESGGGPGTEPPPSNPNNGTGTTVATSKLNWSNSNGGTLPGSPSAGGLPNAPCSNNCAWYTEAPAQNFGQDPNSSGNFILETYADFTNTNQPIDANDDKVIENGITIEDFSTPQTQPSIQPRLIGKTVNRNNTEDISYGLNGDVSGINPNRINKPSNILFTGLSFLTAECTFFDSDLSDVGSLMIERFRINTNNTFNFENQTLNKKVGESSAFKNFLKKFGADFKQKLTQNSSNIDQVSIIDMGANRPVFNGMYNKFHGLQILINDTEYTEIELNDFRNNNGLIEVDLTVTIYDHYGLDKHDALTYQSVNVGFADWWLLQHTRGYVPFITKVVVKKTLKFQI